MPRRHNLVPLALDAINPWLYKAACLAQSQEKADMIVKKYLPKWRVHEPVQERDRIRELVSMSQYTLTLADGKKRKRRFA